MTGYETALADMHIRIHPQSSLDNRINCTPRQREEILARFPIRLTTDDRVYIGNRAGLSWELLTSAAWCNDDDELSRSYQTILFVALKAHGDTISDRLFGYPPRYEEDQELS